MRALTATGLTRRVADRAVFDGLALSLDRGAGVRVTGPSGSGKTTLLRVLAGLDAPDAGEVRLEGRTLAEWGAPVWRAQVAVVPQEPARLDGTPAETVAWMRGLRHGRVGDDPMAWATRWRLPADRWDQPWAALSGGEAQRVALALALCRQPTVLLLDEPTSALDDDATAAVVADLRGRSLVLVSHDPRVVEALALPEVALSQGALPDGAR